jgi:hypothetical protein
MNKQRINSTYVFLRANSLFVVAWTMTLKRIRLWRILLSELWRHVFWQTFTYFSQERIDSIFRAEMGSPGLWLIINVPEELSASIFRLEAWSTGFWYMLPDKGHQYFGEIFCLHLHDEVLIFQVMIFNSDRLLWTFRKNMLFPFSG